ncbi:hypothetical protein FHS43_006614 [Streptosporangium becharense]|uniref:Uncharacterized protein n=1 Tax=Streptosporangium becharense TaxID=1816182 RepID=A0A7W9IA92_9ACTN|nr:hypothetical protein [Streptosporangium becharense]MBB2915294.1 hypothetical protein [Streptosporangium becharense]MBB5817008.1 hypothetical protein [Streptosporangium becharense]
MAEIVLGSVAGYVAAHARCPVVPGLPRDPRPPEPAPATSNAAEG